MQHISSLLIRIVSSCRSMWRMKKWMSENGQIKKEAGQNVVILLENWKKRVRRKQIYRYCLYGILSIASFALCVLLFYQMDSKVPSTIYVRAGQEESFDLNIPAKAQILRVSEQGESNIPKGAVDIDLSEPITMNLASATDELLNDIEEYSMQVKLFGIFPLKQIDIQVMEHEELIPVGVPIGIYVETDGLLVIGTGEFDGTDGAKCSPAKGKIKTGDYIMACDGVAMESKSQFMEYIEESEGKAVQILLHRNEEEFSTTVIPKLNQNGEYKIGIWLRDNAQGVGTMTYIDANGKFGALGHGINDVDTNSLMEIVDGTLYETEIIEINEGSIGKPGEMTGVITYTDERILGDITANSESGIFGVCNQGAMNLSSNKALPIGLKQEVRRGAAQIICTVDGSSQYYDIEITATHLDHNDLNRGLEVRVTDPELLLITGGIIQGMSGSPIIQDGKIIGAVTHVLVNDPTRGYGIFIEEMLEQ